MRLAFALATTLALILACASGAPSVDDPASSTGGATEESTRKAATEPAATEARDLLPPTNVASADSREYCVLEDPGSAEPLLAAKQGNADVEVVRGAHGVAETVRLDSGMQLRIERGGCVDYGETWLLAPAPDGETVDIMDDLVGRLTWANPEEKPSLVRCLADVPEDGPAEDETGGWACGGGDAYVNVRREQDVLEVVWHMAL